MSHANARLTPAGRLLLVGRIEASTVQVVVTRQMGLSRRTVAASDRSGSASDPLSDHSVRVTSCTGLENPDMPRDLAH